MRATRRMADDRASSEPTIAEGQARMTNLPRLGIGLALAGCYGPPDERAKRDLEVGQAATPAITLSIEDGLGAIQELTDEEAVVWANAPRLDLTLVTTEPLPAFRLRMANVMPAAELKPLTDLVLTEEALDLGTRRSFVLDLPAGETRLLLAVPDLQPVGPFRFALLSDIQDALDRVGDVFAKINAEDGIDFLLGAGDLTENGDPAQLRQFQRELEALEIPYYATLGNHELGVRPSAWHDHFGRGNFHFDHRGVAFSYLDSASATIEPTVYDWLADWMAGSAGRLHVVAMHIPPVEPIGLRNGSFASRHEAAKLLGRMARGGVDLTLYGHLHTYFRFDNAGIEAHVSGGGGAIPERFDGIGRHFVVIDLDPERGVTGRRVVRVD
jgi:Icc protein